MPAYQGYKLRPKVEKQRRPIGVAILAVVGVLGSLATILSSLVQLVNLMRVNTQPSIQVAVLGAMLALSLISLWINWGFWEMIRWAWWANLLITLISAGALLATLRFVQPIAAAVVKLRPNLAPGQITNGLLAAIMVLLVCHLIIAIYMLSVRTVFGVGVKDERPLWERMQRH